MLPAASGRQRSGSRTATAIGHGRGRLFTFTGPTQFRIDQKSPKFQRLVHRLVRELKSIVTHGATREETGVTAKDEKPAEEQRVFKDYWRAALEENLDDVRARLIEATAATRTSMGYLSALQAPPRGRGG